MVNKNPINKIDIIIGDNIPYIGQNEIIKSKTQSNPRPVEMGIKFGQYISHGIVIFRTIGSHRVKYRIIPIFATKQTTAAFKDNLNIN